MHQRTYSAVDETSTRDRILGRHPVCDDIEIFILMVVELEEEQRVCEGREIKELLTSVVDRLVGAPNDYPCEAGADPLDPVHDRLLFF